MGRLINVQMIKKSQLINRNFVKKINLNYINSRFNSDLPDFST